MTKKGLLLIFLMSFFVSAISVQAKPKKRISKQNVAAPDVLPKPCKPERVMPLTSEMGKIQTRPVRHVGNSCTGIDVSHYQGHIDWKQVAADNRVAFVYLKATENVGLVDNTYKRNLEGARSEGIPVGVYHFFNPMSAAAAQLQNFCSVVDPRTQDLIPIVDVETPPRGDIASFQSRLRAFIEGVEKHFGCKPLIYTGMHYYNKYLQGKFLDCPFMFARYAEEAPSVSDEVRFVIWQFTASGSINGIRGNVDRSRFMDNYSVKDIMIRHK